MYWRVSAETADYTRFTRSHFHPTRPPLVQPSYWCSSPRMALVNEKEEEEDAEKALKGEFIEEEPAGLVSGIKIKHLVKVSILTRRFSMSHLSNAVSTDS